MRAYYAMSALEFITEANLIEVCFSQILLAHMFISQVHEADEKGKVYKEIVNGSSVRSSYNPPSTRSHIQLHKLTHTHTFYFKHFDQPHCRGKVLLLMFDRPMRALQLLAPGCYIESIESERIDFQTIHL